MCLFFRETHRTLVRRHFKVQWLFKDLWYEKFLYFKVLFFFLKSNFILSTYCIYSVFHSNRIISISSAMFQNSPIHLLVYLQSLINLFDFAIQTKLYLVNRFKNKNTTLTSYFLSLFLIKFIFLFLSSSLSLSSNFCYIYINK